MAVTIPNSAGYGNDSVDAPEWAQIIPNAGHPYGVVTQGSWVARPGAADREVRLTAGTGYGGGILDRTTAEASLILPATTSGSVYHLIYVHRDWNNSRSTFDSKAGTSARQIPGRDTTPGLSDDQPLWLARVDAGKSQVQELVDLRVWNGSYASSELVLQYLNQLGARIIIGEKEWLRYADALGGLAWAATYIRSASAPIALNQGLPEPLYKARGGSQVPTATRSGNRVHLDGAADVIGFTRWVVGQNYVLGTVPSGYRPAQEVGGVIRLGPSWAVVVVQTGGAIIFAVMSEVTANADTAFIALTGMSWPVGG